MKAVLLIALGFQVSCAPRQQGPEMVPIGEGDGEMREESALSPDEYEMIDNFIKGRTEVVGRCYSDVLNEKKDRSFAGRVIVNIHVTESGRADQVVILESTLKSPEVEGCIVETIQSWEFGAVSTDGWFNYPFTFEPRY